MSKRKEMIGKKFGRLTVIKLDEERNRIFREERNKGLRSSSPVCYICECECGNKTEVQQGNLLSGHTTSCGCLQKQKASLNTVDMTGYENNGIKVLSKARTNIS